jgi:hypothetical protein
MREQQEARARRARLVTMARRTPLYQCQRDHVVFVPGTGKAMSISEITGMLERTDPRGNCSSAGRSTRTVKHILF